MANQNPPLRGQAYTAHFVMRLNDGTIIANPMITQKRISKDGAASVGASGSVSVYDTTYGMCSLEITPTEMTADVVTLEFIASGSTAIPTVLTIDTYNSTQIVQLPTNTQVFVTGTVTISDGSVDAIWDEVLTGATHNVTSSSGRRLRQIASQVVHDGTAQGAGADSNQIQLDAGASALDGAYDPSVIAIVGGTGSGQCRLIFQYNGTTKMATVDRNWKVNPDNTSEFIIFANPGREHVNEGLAQAGGASSVTLNTNASPYDNAYVGQIIFLRSGTGQDQVRLVSAYNGTTKVATVSEPWDAVPDTTTAYVMLPAHIHEISEIADGVWDEATAGHVAAGTFGALLATISTAVSSIGATVWGYVTRTLTSGGGGSGASAADVWTYTTRTLTQTALQIVQSLTDNTQINVYKSSTFNILLENLPDFTGWQAMWFTVKEESALELPDSESIFQIQLTAPTGTASDGLLYINKDAATTPTNGYLEVVSTTSIRMKLKAAETGDLPPKTLYYGIKYLNSSNDVVPLSEGGEFVIHHSTSKKVS